MPDLDAVHAGAVEANAHGKAERRNSATGTYASIGLAGGALLVVASKHPDLNTAGRVLWDAGIAVGVLSILLMWLAGMPGIDWHAEPGTGNVFQLHAAVRAGRLEEVLSRPACDQTDAAVRQVEKMTRLAWSRYMTVWAGQAGAVLAGGLFGLALLVAAV